MAEIIYVKDANGNLVQTTIKDLGEYELEQLEKENKKLREDLEFRVIELERVVKELIKYKENADVRYIDDNGVSWQLDHDYKFGD